MKEITIEELYELYERYETKGEYAIIHDGEIIGFGKEERKNKDGIIG